MRQNNIHLTYYFSLMANTIQLKGFIENIRTLANRGITIKTFGILKIYDSKEAPQFVNFVSFGDEAVKAEKAFKNGKKVFIAGHFGSELNKTISEEIMSTVVIDSIESEGFFKKNLDETWVYQTLLSGGIDTRKITSLPKNKGYISGFIDFKYEDNKQSFNFLVKDESIFDQLINLDSYVDVIVKGDLISLSTQDDIRSETSLLLTQLKIV